MLKGIFEATEVLTPTTFIILDEKLLDEPNEKQKQQLLKLSLKEDGSGFDVGGELGDVAKDANKKLELGKRWLTRLKKFGKGVMEGSADAVFGAVKEALGDLVTGERMYFYLVDELTGEPVRGDGYPIEITTPSEIVPKLLPVMQVGMRAMSLYNGAAGIACMFGYPIPKVPEKWRKGAQSSVEMLKQVRPSLSNSRLSVRLRPRHPLVSLNHVCA